MDRAACEESISFTHWCNGELHKNEWLIKTIFYANQGWKWQNMKQFHDLWNILLKYEYMRFILTSCNHEIEGIFVMLFQILVIFLTICDIHVWAKIPYQRTHDVLKWHIVTVLDAIYHFSYLYKSTTPLSRNAVDTADPFLLIFEVKFNLRMSAVKRIQ
jgi:hypothetical protein